MTSIRPMPSVDAVQVAPPNPFGAGRIVRDLAFLTVALILLGAAHAGWQVMALASVFWLGHWSVWGWLGYQKWRAWRDSPPVAPGGSPATR